MECLSAIHEALDPGSNAAQTPGMGMCICDANTRKAETEESEMQGPPQQIASLVLGGGVGCV